MIIRRETKVCVVCGADTTVSSLGSIFISQTGDLDGRPPGMGMSKQSQYLPHCTSCHFCSFNIEELPFWRKVPLSQLQPLLASDDYRCGLRANRVGPIPAFRLHCLLARAQDTAGWACLWAAWNCDDYAGQGESQHSQADADRWRRQALLDWSQLAPDLDRWLVTVDLMRRTGQIDEARAQLERLSNHLMPSYHRQVLEQQKGLLAMGDLTAQRCTAISTETACCLCGQPVPIDPGGRQGDPELDGRPSTLSWSRCLQHCPSCGLCARDIERQPFWGERSADWLRQRIAQPDYCQALQAHDRPAELGPLEALLLLTKEPTQVARTCLWAAWWCDDYGHLRGLARDYRRRAWQAWQTSEMSLQDELACLDVLRQLEQMQAAREWAQSMLAQPLSLERKSLIEFQLTLIGKNDTRPYPLKHVPKPVKPNPAPVYKRPGLGPRKY